LPQNNIEAAYTKIIAFRPDNHNLKIYWISNNNGKYFLNSSNFSTSENQFTYKQTELPRSNF